MRVSLRAALLVLPLIIATVAITQAAASDGNDPFRGGALPPPSNPTLALTEHLRAEAWIFHAGLTRLAGTAEPCPAPCNRVDEPVMRWRTLGVRCGKLGLQTLPTLPAYRAHDHVQLHAALAAACGTINAALRRQEPPQNNFTWRTLAKAADLLLARALAGR